MMPHCTAGLDPDPRDLRSTPVTLCKPHGVPQPRLLPALSSEPLSHMFCGFMLAPVPTAGTSSFSSLLSHVCPSHPAQNTRGLHSESPPRERGAAWTDQRVPGSAF